MALLVWFTMGIALWHFTIWLPDREDDHPSREHLEWHADTVFLG